MYYTVYKITNTINNKIYVGVHKTNNLEDGYMGSGKVLKLAITKYGLINFKKDILFVYKTSKEMFAKELEIVNEDFVNANNTYNLKIGGAGGWEFINNSGLNGVNFQEQVWNKGLKTGPMLDKVKSKISDTLKEKYENEPHHTKGIKHTLEARQNMALSHSQPQRIVKCDYCAKEGGLANMKRYHFENCKFKEKCEYFD